MYKSFLYVYKKVFNSIKQWAKYDEMKSSWLNASHNKDYETIKISMAIDLAYSVLLFGQSSWL